MLFAAVRKAWLTYPTANRPKLLVLDRSLGAYGSQAAFASLDDLSSNVDGAVWVGAPRFTPLWSQITTNGQAGLARAGAGA